MSLFKMLEEKQPLMICDKLPFKVYQSFALSRDHCIEIIRFGEKETYQLDWHCVRLAFRISLGWRKYFLRCFPILNVFWNRRFLVDHWCYACLTTSFLIHFRSMSGNFIQYLPDKSFSGNKKLTILRLKNNPIMSVGLKAFANLPRLENL